jgi:acyl-CoA synthetase (AMP-forming)/AMP-acid ligase II
VVILPRFDEIQVLQAIEKYKITWGLVVPPILLALLHSQNVAKFDISSLRGMQSGAAPLGKQLCEAFEKKYPAIKVTQGYGLTETTPVTHVMTVDEGPEHRGKIGRLIPTLQARLVDTESGEDVRQGQPGEMWFRGPSVMKGYWRNHEATKNAFAEGGWFKTGDVAIMDDQGYFSWVPLKFGLLRKRIDEISVVDRVKELIKYKGFQGERLCLYFTTRTAPR